MEKAKLNIPSILLFEITGTFILYLGCRMAIELLTGDPAQSFIIMLLTQVPKFIALYVYSGLIIMVLPLLIWLFGYWKRFVYAVSIMLALIGIMVDGVMTKTIYIAVAASFAFFCFFADPE